MIKLPSIYAGNILIEALGPIPTERDLTRELIHLPPRPDFNPSDWHSHFALHEMQALEDLYVPPQVSKEISLTYSLGVRNGYRPRNPIGPATASMIRGRPEAQFSLAPPWMMSVCGPPGVGKSQAMARAALQTPQVLEHKSFPGVVGKFMQLVYLRIDVPGSGRLVDLCRELMRATDRALATEEFHAVLKMRLDAWDMFNRWLLVARRHFLGFIILDEAQNLFKLETKRARERNRKNSELIARELRLVEDETLKAILNIANTWKIPVSFSMTPDGRQAFNTRLAATQRLCGDGHHEFPVATTSEDPFIANQLLPKLAVYQYLPQKLIVDKPVRQVIFEQTAYVPRIMIKCWKAGQRIAIEAGDMHFGVEHIRRAMDTYLAPLKPAVQVLLSGDPIRMQRYQDLLPPPEFWKTIG